MIQGFTINWDSSPGKLAYSSPPSTLPQPLTKKDSFPWTVGHDRYHSLSMWSMEVCLRGCDLCSCTVPPSLQPISFFIALSGSLLNKWKKKPTWCYAPKQRPAWSLWWATEDLFMERPWWGPPWADAETPALHPGVQGERDGGQGLFQN